jgi:hypothetical protein
MDTYRLENDRLSMEFDKATGALPRLVFKDTGWQVQRRAELAQAFGLLVPVPGKRNNRVIGRHQSLTYVSPDGNTLRLTWEDLRSEGGEVLDIVFTGTVTLSDNRLEFTATIENRTEHVVEACIWPWLGDLARPQDTSEFYHLHATYGNWVNELLYPRFESHRGCFGVEHPMQLSTTPSTPFLLAHSGSEGLYVGYHDTTCEHLAQFRFELFPGFEFAEAFEAGTVPKDDTIGGAPVHLECAVVHFPFAGPGSTELKPVVLAPYRGTWHHGADIYKAWKKTWYTPPRKPEWLKQVHSWQQIHVNSPEEEYAVPYCELRTIADDCAAHGVGAVQITGWASGGQDRNNPSHDTESGLGTWEDLRDAIAYMESRGVHAILFSKFTWSDRSTERYRNDLHRLAMKDPYGDAYYYPGYMYMTETQLANINTRRFIPMCMQSAEWRDVAVEEFKKVVALGPSGTLYDECQHHGGANYCFDDSHGHPIPAHVFAGDAPLAEAFQEASGPRDELFLLAGEDCYDLQLCHYQLSYFRIGANHLPVHRYIAQDTEMMVAVLGYNNRTVINQALLFRYILSYEPRGFKGRLSEFPLTLEYGKRVDALRRRYSDYLWDAEFCDTQGAEVALLDGSSKIQFSVFVSHVTGKRAVVVVNTGYEEAVTVQVRLEPGANSMVVATPEQPDAVSSDGCVMLNPVSAAVILEI